MPPVNSAYLRYCRRNEVFEGAVENNRGSPGLTCIRASLRCRAVPQFLDEHVVRLKHFGSVLAGDFPTVKVSLPVLFELDLDVPLGPFLPPRLFLVLFDAARILRVLEGGRIRRLRAGAEKEQGQGDSKEAHASYYNGWLPFSTKNCVRVSSVFLRLRFILFVKGEAGAFIRPWLCRWRGATLAPDCCSGRGVGPSSRMRAFISLTLLAPPALDRESRAFLKPLVYQMKHLRKAITPIWGPLAATNRQGVSPSPTAPRRQAETAPRGRAAAPSAAFSPMAARSRNIHGFPRAPLAIIAASHPVSSMTHAAASEEKRSPLAMTGMHTAFFTAPITDASALPLYAWSLVRPWTQTALAPAASTRFAISGALIDRLSHPARIFTVTGTGECSTRALTIRDNV